MSLIKKASASVLTLALITTVATPHAAAWSFSDIFGSKKSNIEQAKETEEAGVGVRKGMMRVDRDGGRRNDDRDFDGMMGGKNMLEKGAAGMMGGKIMGAAAPSAELQKLMDELKTAREAGDKTKVTELREKIKAQRTADMKARSDALDTAIAGGYETWKAYVTAQKLPTGMLSKITADNFATFAELHATQKKMRALTEKLGIGGPDEMPLWK